MDGTVILFYYSIDGCKTEPRALSGFLGGEKGFKQTRFGLFIHSATVVFYTEQHILPRFLNRFHPAAAVSCSATARGAICSPIAGRYSINKHFGVLKLLK